MGWRRLLLRARTCHQVVHRSGECHQIFVPFWMMRERDEDVMPPKSGNDGGVMPPILPRTPFSDDLDISIRQRFDELDAVMRDVRRRKNLAHGLRSCGRNQFSLLQQKKIAEQ